MQSNLSAELEGKRKLINVIENTYSDQDRTNVIEWIGRIPSVKYHDGTHKNKNRRIKTTINWGKLAMFSSVIDEIIDERRHQSSCINEIMSRKEKKRWRQYVQVFPFFILESDIVLERARRQRKTTRRLPTVLNGLIQGFSSSNYKEKKGNLNRQRFFLRRQMTVHWYFMHNCCGLFSFVSSLFFSLLCPSRKNSI